MERAVDGDGIGKDYFRVWRETLFILRLSLADVTTLCLGFKNCTVALFFRDTDPNFRATFCDAASLSYIVLLRTCWSIFVTSVCFASSASGNLTLEGSKRNKTKRWATSSFCFKFPSH